MAVRNRYNRHVRSFMSNPSRTYYDRIKTSTYKITKPATNGGRSCPHKDGEKKEENIGQCIVGPRRGSIPNC